MAQLVADVLVLLFAGLGAAAAAVPAAAAAAASRAASAAGSIERQVVGVVVLRLRHHDLRGRGRSGGGCRRGGRAATSSDGRGRLQGLRLRVHLVQVPAGRAQVAERPHDAPVVPAAAHGYFGEGVALAARRGLVRVVVRRVRMVVVRERGPGAQAAQAARGTGGGLAAVALVVLGGGRRLLRVVLPGRTGMAGRRQLAHIELAAPARRAAAARRARQRRGGAEQQGQVIPRPRARPRGPAGGAAVAPEAWAAPAAARLRVAGSVREGREGRARLVLALVLLAVQVRGARRRRRLREEAALELQ